MDQKTNRRTDTVTRHIINLGIGIARRDGVLHAARYLASKGVALRLARRVLGRFATRHSRHT